MSNRVPAGAFPECEKLETPHLLKPDGTQAPVFKSRAASLAEMRKAVNEHEDRIAALEGRELPFPFGAA